MTDAELGACFRKLIAATKEDEKMITPSPEDPASLGPGKIMPSASQVISLYDLLGLPGINSSFGTLLDQVKALVGSKAARGPRTSTGSSPTTSTATSG